MCHFTCHGAFIVHCLQGLVILCALVAVVGGSECTDACDEKYSHNANKPFITICGTDGLTHTFRHQRWGWGDPCYPKCGVMMKYAGRCGCPNECMAHVGHGQCAPVEGGTDGDGPTLLECRCNAGWGGADCSRVVCPHNACSGHGRCAPYNVETSLPGELDRCICDANYTDFMCGTHKPHLPSEPYGSHSIYGEEGQYSAYDSYGDHHPVFNTSVLFNIHVTLSAEDWEYLNDARQLYTQEYRPAEFLFDNGNHRVSVNQIGFRAKGAWTRSDMKHGFSFSFTAFSKQRRFFGLRRMGLKGANENDIFVKDQMAMEFGKASGIPTQRTSFGFLWVNGLFRGLFWGHEDIDEVFALTRFGNSQGNIYKLAGVSMRYESTEAEFYRTATMPNPMTLVNRYEQNNGNGTLAAWTDFVELLKFLHYGVTKDSKFQANLARRIDIKMFLRWCVIEAFMQDWDGIYGNNNYQWYNSNGVWKYLRVDFDNSNLQNSRHIMDWYTNKFGTNPLIRHVFTLYNHTYADYFGQFLTRIFGAQSPHPLPLEPVPVTRYREYRNMLVGAYRLDYPWQISTGMTEVEFVKNCNWNMQNLVKRYHTAQSQATVWTAPILPWTPGGAGSSSARRGPIRPMSSTAGGGGGTQPFRTSSSGMYTEDDQNAAHLTSLKQGLLIFCVAAVVLTAMLLLLRFCRRPSLRLLHGKAMRSDDEEALAMLSLDKPIANGKAVALHHATTDTAAVKQSSGNAEGRYSSAVDASSVWPISPILTKGLKVIAAKQQLNAAPDLETSKT